MARFTEDEQKRLNELNGERARIKAAARKRQDSIVELPDWRSARLEQERLLRIKIEEEKAVERVAQKKDFDDRLRRTLIALTNEMHKNSTHLVAGPAFQPGWSRDNKVDLFKMVDSKGILEPVQVRWVYGRGFEWD
jgi:hypothetical protein